MADLQAHIEQLWDLRDELDVGDPEVGRVVLEAIGMLDSGEARADAHRFYERERPSWRSVSFAWEL